MKTRKQTKGEKNALRAMYEATVRGQGEAKARAIFGDPKRRALINAMARAHAWRHEND